MSCDFPASHFIRALLTDIGLNPFEITKIELKLLVVAGVFNNNFTGKLSDISTELYDCLNAKVGMASTIAATEIGVALILLIITTAIFVILSFLIYYLANKNGILVFGLLFLFIILYIIICIIIIWNAGLNITKNINDLKADVVKCTDEFLDNIIALENNFSGSIEKALCAYPQFETQY